MEQLEGGFGWGLISATTQSEIIIFLLLRIIDK